MNTKFPLLLVIALAGATLIWTMSGVGDLYGQSDPIGSDSEAADALEEQADEAPQTENGSFNTTAHGRGETSLPGMVVSAGKFMISFATIVTHLPQELMKLGFPAYFAVPLGIISQALVGIGIVQFLADRVYN
jgi:hypothetical protein